MRVRLKGLHAVKVRLAGGRVTNYHYAWRGGPRLQGEPGSPEFIASYNAAVATKVAPPPGTLQELIRYFERNRGVFKEWRSGIAQRSRRQADYAWTVLARILAVAKDHGKIRVNPCERGGRLYDGSRRDKVWSLDDEKVYLDAAPAHMRLPILLGAWTGQRQGDLLRLPWSAYDGKFIRLRQSKTGVHVCVPTVGPLKEALDAEKARKRGLLILLTKKGQKWTEDGFRVSWRKACTKAGISGLTFHDLRGTAVTRLKLAGCNEAETAVFTGLSMADVRGILERHYLHRDPKLAESAGAKLAKLAETGTTDPNSAK
jgi:integrase